jgi:hypothetical protein
MTVFDSGNFSEQERKRRKKIKDLDDVFRLGAEAGYDLGYAAATDRYLPLGHR